MTVAILLKHHDISRPPSASRVGHTEVIGKLSETALMQRSSENSKCDRILYII